MNQDRKARARIIVCGKGRPSGDARGGKGTAREGLTNTAHRRRVGASITLSLGVALSPLACLPIPHTDHRAPDLDGTVYDGGAPRANVEVLFDVNGPPCKGAAGTTHTDAGGHFHLEGPKSFAMLMVWGDRHDEWSVCANLDGRVVTTTASGMWGGPKKAVLDLGSPKK